MPSRHGRAGRFRLACALLALAALVLAPVASSHAQPRDIVLMLDNSGSMRKNDPDFLTRVAVRTFLEGLRGDNHVAVVAFDQGVRLLMPLTALDDNTRARFLGSLDAINYAGLLTNSPAALERSLYELRENGRAAAEKSIVFMTDGIVDVAPEGPDAGDVEKGRWMKSTLADAAAEAGVRIFGIAFTDNADFELIQTLARRTGGEYYRAYTPSDIDGVFESVRGRLSVAGTTPPAASPPPAPAPSPPAGTPVTPAPEARTTPGLPALPDSTTAAPSAPAADTGTRLPDAATPLPGIGGGATLPEVSLPEKDIPKVSLPDVNLGGSSGTPAGAASGDTGAKDGAAKGEAPPAAAATPVTGTATAPAPPVVSAPPPAPAGGVTDDPKLMIALAVGGAALLLALAALVIVLLRRRGRPAAQGDPLMPKAYLNDIGGVTANKSYELGAKPLIVGRIKGPDAENANYIVIDESTVGRRHALLEYKDHSFWVTDQNSLNGTFVNNARIEAPARLKHGDRIRFHKHEFEFLVLDMFETDRTMMSETVFANVARDADGDAADDEDATVVREGSEAEPSPEDPTVTRP